MKSVNLEKQKISILRWLMCAHEYIEDSNTLFISNLDKNLITISRPTILLFAYFLENLVKTCIIIHENLQDINFKKHLSEKLYNRAGLKYKLSNQEKGLFLYLSETLNWGKYPIKEENNHGSLVMYNSKNRIMIFANETIYFSEKENFHKLILMAKSILNSSYDLISNYKPTFDFEFLLKQIGLLLLDMGARIVKELENTKTFNQT